MVPARATKFRLNLLTAASLLAVIAGLLAISQSALAAPDRPMGLTATALDHDTVSLTWSHPDEANVDHYQVLRRSADQGRLSQVATTQTTSFQDDGLQPETTYIYRVRAMDSEGARSRSSVRSQTTTAAAPTITPVQPIPEPTPEHSQAKGDESDEQGQTITPRSSHLAAPTNFRVTNATLTNGVYVLANHDDDPVLDWDYTRKTITITQTDDGYTLSQPYSYQGYDETGFKFTRKWIDSDATCGANCPWLVVARFSGTGHTHFTDDFIAPGTYTFRIQGLDANNNPGPAAEITVRLPDPPTFVPAAPTNLSVTAGISGRAATLKGSWVRVDTPYYQTPPAFIVQWKSGNEEYNTAVDGNRSLINAWSGPQMLGADGNDQWSRALNRFYLRHNSESNGFTPTLALDTTYTVRVGTCLTTACDLDDVVFASERTATTPN